MGAVLPGNSSVELKEFPIPEPGYGQVLIKTKSSTICGSDIRAIYREHLGKGPEGYQNKIAGHEPCGQIVEEGPGLKRFKKGDRVIVYHISGCGVCYDCRRGYMISCTSPFRAAYGWQRDGGMAPYILAEEKDLVVLAKAMGANKLIGVDAVDERLEIAQKLGLADHVLKAGPENVGEIRSLTNGHGVERALDASGSDKGRLTAIQATRKWGRIALVGEGGTPGLSPSPDMIHDQKTVYGSWGGSCYGK